MGKGIVRYVVRRLAELDDYFDEISVKEAVLSLVYGIHCNSQVSVKIGREVQCRLESLERQVSGAFKDIQDRLERIEGGGDGGSDASVEDKPSLVDARFALVRLAKFFVEGNGSLVGGNRYVEGWMSRQDDLYFRALSGDGGMKVWTVWRRNEVEGEPPTCEGQSLGLTFEEACLRVCAQRVGFDFEHLTLSGSRLYSSAVCAMIPPKSSHVEVKSSEQPPEWSIATKCLMCRT